MGKTRAIVKAVVVACTQAAVSCWLAEPLTVIACNFYAMYICDIAAAILCYQ